LLRSYEGIFDFPVTIYESLLARFLKADTPSTVTCLKQLHHYGVIQYQPLSDKPQLFLLKNRMYSDDFKIDRKQILLRRHYYEERVNAMINYLQESGECRAVILAAYFGAPIKNNCRICDNCISKQEGSVSAEDFKLIETSIHELLQPRPLEINLLVKSVQNFRQVDTWKVLNFLLAEEKLEQTGEGLIRIKNI
jgi:ATP-dependent DNA helicase RecQ